MKYYLISNSADSKVVGCYPQTKGLVDGYEEYAENSMVNLTSDEFPSFIPDLRFELEDDAILTDIISPSNLDYANGLLLNEKSKNIFSHFKIMPHEFYDASIKIGNKVIKYYWMHLVNPSFEGIDFNTSIFLELCPGDLIKKLSFNSETDLETYSANTINRVIVENLRLKPYLKEIDLIFYPFIHSGLISSEHLCKSLKDKNITGLSFDEQSFII